jgi:hypothetical protein
MPGRFAHEAESLPKPPHGSAGGTVGVSGITYQWSLDGGMTWSPTLALGVATSIIILGSGGIQFDLTSATLNAGDHWSIRAHAPTWAVSDLAVAMNAIKNSAQDVKAVWIAGAIDATAQGAISTWLNSVQATTGKMLKVYAHARVPSAGESEANYLASMTTGFADSVDFRITCTAGAARVQSSRPGRNFVYRRAPLFAIAGLSATLPLAIDMAQTIDATPNALPGVSLYDANGNRLEHDEMMNPGLSDVRLLTLRTWPGKAGVYVDDPVTLEQVGGDFHLDQMVRILSAFCNTARATLTDELSRALDLNASTQGINVAGAPTERECQRIDARVLEALRNVLRGQVSDLQFAVRRDDQILSTQTLHADGGILFKGYPKLIVFTVAAINPAAAA